MLSCLMRDLLSTTSTFLCVFFPKVADQVLTDQVKNLIQSLCKNLHTVSSSYDLTKHSPIKHLNGDLRALILVQAGVQEIDKAQLRDSVRTLKERTVSQLHSLRDSDEDGDVGKVAESRRDSEEKRKSVDEKSSLSTSVTEEAKETAASATTTPNSSSKRLSPLDKLRETLLSFERSLDMLLVDVAKNEEDKSPEDTNDDNQNKSDNKKEENSEEPPTGGPSTSK